MANELYQRAIFGNPPERETADFYCTPAWGTEALLAAESFVGRTWEPACGDGAISRVLEKRLGKKNVISTDLYDQGYGKSGIDFLQASRNVENIITNPPYSLAEEFAHHALSQASSKVAILCRLSWLESVSRYDLFTKTPLARVWVFSSRLNCASKRWLADNPGRAKDGMGGVVAYAWYVWTFGHRGSPAINWLLHPNHSAKRK